MTEATPAPAPAAAAPATYPGKTLGIVGLIVAFFASVVGIIISAIALKQSKDAGYKNTPAKVGVILGSIFAVLTVVLVVASIALGGLALNAAINEVCEGQPSGTELTDGTTTYTCP